MTGTGRDTSRMFSAAQERVISGHLRTLDHAIKHLDQLILEYIPGQHSAAGQAERQRDRNTFQAAAQAWTAALTPSEVNRTQPLLDRLGRENEISPMERTGPVDCYVHPATWADTIRHGLRNDGFDICWIELPGGPTIALRPDDHLDLDSMHILDAHQSLHLRIPPAGYSVGEAEVYTLLRDRGVSIEDATNTARDTLKPAEEAGQAENWLTENATASRSSKVAMQRRNHPKHPSR